MNTIFSNQEALLALESETPESLQSVYHRITHGCRDAIALRCSTKTLLVLVNPDNEKVGSPVDFGWIGINQQGYCDSVMLSFGELTPALLLHVIASSISLMRITEVLLSIEVGS